MTQHFLLGQAAKIVGVPAYRINYAISNGYLPEPEERLSNHRIFTASDIAGIKAYFAAKPAKGGRHDAEKR
jgi:DNA-binding transcriptional MerR regulator